MLNNVKLATWNLCLGLSNKKDLVTQSLSRNNISACCVQETEIPINYPEEILDCNDYILELELNNLKKRAGIYIRKNVKYVRRKDLERENYHIVVIDVTFAVNFRLICIYRSFRPQDLIAPTTFFETQLSLIDNALTSNCYVMGDFNLDSRMDGRPDYDRKVPLNILTNFALEKNLIQIVNETTWSRVINGTKKESLLDHVYVNNLASVLNVSNDFQIFGDHALVVVELCFKALNETRNFTVRNWNKYSTVNLNTKLSCELNLNTSEFEQMSVQDHWNTLENALINTIDEIAPLFYPNQEVKNSKKLSPCIKNKVNKRKRLLRLNRINNSVNKLPEIRALNREIKAFFLGEKISNVRRAGLGVKGNLWKAVKAAKNLNTNDLPSDLTLGAEPVAGCDVANSFAKHFSDKIKLNISKTNVNLNAVYNGKCKLIVQNRNFMLEADVKECILDLPNKKCEGFDRLPVCLLRDSCDTLLKPISSLFSKIYATGQIPEQWKVSKIIPIFKKGSKNQIENYRPIANLCAASKIFEKLILKQIHYLEKTNKLDLTGKQQHGFKKNKSTATVGTLLQSMIARAADANCFVVMASLDLSMAFDMVNIELLVKRLRIMGMPRDIIELIREWLFGRSFYVQVGEDSSALFGSNVGTIQGSVLGPILYALFVSPLFDIANITNFADDNFCLVWNKEIGALIVDLERKLEMITKWLRDSGLVVNQSKTEICLFHKQDQLPIQVTVENVVVTSKKSMNVLGVTFDSKLDWSIQIASCINKAKKKLFALKLLKNYFTPQQMRILLDSQFYSVLYYNSVIWLTSEIRASLKHDLMSISANALRSCIMKDNYDVSFENIHLKCKKCTPNQISLYQSALKLHKTVNENLDNLSFEQITVFDQIICTSRQTNFQISRRNNFKVGMNTTANKLFALSNKISLGMLNLTFVHFKKLAKIQFLKYGNT